MYMYMHMYMYMCMSVGGGLLTTLKFTIWTQASVLPSVEGVLYNYHATYFHYKLVAGAI